MATLSRGNLSSIAVQLILLSLTAGLVTAAPTSAPSASDCAELNATQALTQMKNGIEVLRRVHEGKLFSVIRDEEDESRSIQSNTFSLDLLSKALNITCALRDAKANLWSLEAITGEQPDADVRLLRYVADKLVRTSCEWTKNILSQLYPQSMLHLQCTCEEIDYICDEFNFLSQAKETILIMEAYNPTISGEISWIETNLPQPDFSMPLLQRFVQYVHNEPMGL
ncbi:uncharacterized protein LOC135334663 [Halichondria panicea]|uniref:uncharacterized protein LOC135334663 n=1 Tax=Halichondria panicea TaxID=6063 RepID=UPI00312BA670